MDAGCLLILSQGFRAGHFTRATACNAVQLLSIREAERGESTFVRFDRADRPSSFSHSASFCLDRTARNFNAPDLVFKRALEAHFTRAL